MGRPLSIERREAAIAVWRDRLALALSSPRPSVRSLAGLVGTDPALVDSGKLVRWQEARRQLVAALSLPTGPKAAAVDAWIGRHFVDRGRSLLIAPAERDAVFAHVRDLARRAKEKQSLVRIVTLEVTADVRDRLRSYRTAKKFKVDAEAIASLLDEAGFRKRAKKRAEPAGEPNLFDRTDN